MRMFLQDMIVLGFMAYFISSIENSSPLPLKLMVPMRNREEFLLKDIRHKHGMSRLETQHLEEEELQKFQKKWTAFGFQNMPHNTIMDIPRDWLLPTSTRNVTFNATRVRGIVGKKLANMIKEHQVSEKSRNHILTKNLTKKDLKQQGFSSLKDQLQAQAKKVSKTLSKTANANQMENLSEYPGTNETMRRHLAQQWGEYYKCLQSSMSFKPKAHYVFPGEAIMLPCLVCLRPGGGSQIKWYMTTVGSKSKEVELDFTKRINRIYKTNRIAIRERGLRLYIYGVNEKDAGNYSCHQYETLYSFHLIQVADSTENMTKVWLRSIPGKEHPTSDVNLPSFGVTVFTKWKNWTSCSQCGRVGKRFRVGVCTVKATDRKAPAMLRLFDEGIPCRSKILPKSVQSHSYVESRRSEIMEAFCKEPCPKEGKYIVKDKNGQIIEEADNSKGVYSMLQKLPNLPPLVKRKILFLKQWDTAYLLCPGSFQSDIPVHWFIRDLSIHTNGDRIYVTPSHILVVEELGLADSNLYSCWQGSKLVGTVRLVVSQPIRLSFAQQISAISMILIVATVIIIFGRAFCNALHSSQDQL